MIISVFPNGYIVEQEDEGGGGGDTPQEEGFTYTGSYLRIDDGEGNWRLKFWTGGTLTLDESTAVDLFAVGGGGGGQTGRGGSNDNETWYFGGGGGAGGETVTVSNVTLAAGRAYQIVIGEGGAIEYDGHDTTLSDGTDPTLEDLITAHGGRTGEGSRGGSGANGGGAYPYGGSGGGGSSRWSSVPSEQYDGGPGGSNGAGGGGSTPGTGSGRTTREFGEPDGDLYAGGGAGGNVRTTTMYAGGAGGGGNGACYDKMGNAVYAGEGRANTGGGGGGGRDNMKGAPGGSGILIIRNHRGE